MCYSLNLFKRHKTTNNKCILKIKYLKIRTMKNCKIYTLKTINHCWEKLNKTQKWIDTSHLLIGRLNTISFLIPVSLLTDRFRVISIKILEGRWKSDSKIHRGMQRNQNSQHGLEEQNWVIHTTRYYNLNTKLQWLRSLYDLAQE